LKPALSLGPAVPAEIAGLPRPLVLGLAVGGLASLGVAGLFLVADRHFGSAPSRQGTSGATRRRAEFRRYLRDIGEPFAEDHPVAGESVAFYLPERNVAVTFDARAYYRILRTATEPVLVEHEMPGHVLGARLPFETPAIAGDAGDQRDPTAAAFAELDLPVGAEAESVTAAYRDLVTEVHPDQGGDEAAFRRLREAYTTAKEHARD
jgi:hypothetical protein